MILRYIGVGLYLWYYYFVFIYINPWSHPPVAVIIWLRNISISIWSHIDLHVIMTNLLCVTTSTIRTLTENMFQLRWLLDVLHGLADDLLHQVDDEEAGAHDQLRKEFHSDLFPSGFQHFSYLKRCLNQKKYSGWQFKDL